VLKCLQSGDSLHSFNILSCVPTAAERALTVLHHYMTPETKPTVITILHAHSFRVSRKTGQQPLEGGVCVVLRNYRHHKNDYIHNIAYFHLLQNMKTDGKMITNDQKVRVCTPATSACASANILTAQLH
jgi:hypothetical protein